MMRMFSRLVMPLCLTALVWSGTACQEPAEKGPRTGTGQAAAGAPQASDGPYQQVASKSQKEVLRARAEELWTARVTQSLGTFEFRDSGDNASRDEAEQKIAEACALQFQFEDPVQLKMTEVTQTDYVQWCSTTNPFLTKDAEVYEVAVDGNLGWVDVEHSTLVRNHEAVPSRTVRAWQKWQMIEGKWYPVPVKGVKYYPASPSERDLAAEPRLRQRWEASWKVRKDADWYALYKLLDPRDVVGRDVNEFARFMGQDEYTDAELRWVEAIGDTGRVRVEYMVKPNDPNLSRVPPESREIVEPWTKFEGEWYLDVEMN